MSKQHIVEALQCGDSRVKLTFPDNRAVVGKMEFSKGSEMRFFPLEKIHPETPKEGKAHLDVLIEDKLETSIVRYHCCCATITDNHYHLEFD